MDVKYDPILGKLREQDPGTVSEGDIQKWDAKQNPVSITVGFENADYICDGEDDDVQIQAAIDSLTTGGTILLQSGDYYISAPIEIKVSGTIIKGQGITTVINNTQTDYEDGHAFFCNQPTNRVWFAGIENLKIVQESTSGDAIHVTGLCNHSWVKDVFIHGGYRGVYAMTCWTTAWENVTVEYTVSDGMYFGNGSANEISIFHCTVNNCGGHGLYSYGGLGWNVINFDAELNSGYGVYLDWGNTKLFKSCYFENNTLGDVYKTHGSTGEISFESCYHQNNLGDGTAIAYKLVGGNVKVIDPQFSGTQYEHYIEIDATINFATIRVHSDYYSGINNLATANTMITYSGNMILPGNMTSGNLKIVRKTADETLNNNNTLQNDDELYFAIGANEIWEFTFYVRYSKKASSDFQSDLVVPSGATGGFHLYNDSTNTQNERAFGTPITYVGTSDQTPIIGMQGVVINGANAGNVQFKWAQNSAVAEDTKVLANSYLIAHKLN